MNGEFRIPTVVIDGGSTVFKAGFSGDEFPKSVLSSVIGRPRYQPVLPCLNYRDHYIGEEAQRMRGVLALAYPLYHGMIIEEDDAQKIYNYVFEKELKIDPSEYSLLLTETALNPKKQREYLTEMMFETFQVPSLYIALQEVLSVYAAGLVTGAVLYSGGGVTTAVPVCEGYTMAYAMMRMNFGGSDVTNYMIRILAEKGSYFKTSAEVEIARDMKEKLCYVASDFKEAISTSRNNPDLQKTFYLPDDHAIRVGSERFRSPEMLFTPEVAGIEALGVQDIIHQAVLRSDLNIYKQLFKNVVISGGNTMFPGFQDRLRSELVKLVNPNVQVKVIAPPERKYTVWIGGSILGSLTSLERMSIKSAEYKEYGSQIVHKKCFAFMNPRNYGQGDTLP